MVLSEIAVIDSELMAAICAVDITAICALVKVAISLDEVAAILAVDKALICTNVLLESPVIPDAI